MTYRHDGAGAPISGTIAGPVESVLVVGAGMAGLTVANALTHAGVPVTVVEARSRVGGRTHTVDFGPTSVDLGASWIHEPTENPLARLAQSLGVGRRRYEAFEEASGWDPDDGELSTNDEFRDLYTVAESVLEAALDADGPLQTAIDQAAAAMSLPRPQRGRAVALARLFGEADSSGPLESLRADAFPANTLAFEGSPMGDVPQGGYRQIVAALADGLDVRLNSPVTSVSVGSDDAAVSLQDGSSLHASHIVVTVPLGVLKEGSIQFAPNLGPERLAAIDRLGFGRFDKLVMRYDHTYWRDDGVAHLIITPSTHSAPVHALLSLDEVLGVPVLMVFAFGSTHRWISEGSLEDVTRRGHAILCEALGRAVPEPLDSIRSDWWRDPWTLGAYTYLAKGSTYDDLELLGTPHAGRILFAGEATGAARTGFADGAILTGVREAKRLTGLDAVTLARLAP